MISPADKGDVTRLLCLARQGHGGAIDELLPIVYEELRRLAQSFLLDERPGHTLSATALVHEAYVKLAKQETWGASDRTQFFGVAAKAMRRILVDHARTKRRMKRSASSPLVGLDDEFARIEERAIDVLGLDDALHRLQSIDPIKVRLMELRFFGGLSMQTVADMLDMPLRTAERHWTMARAWLRAQLSDAGEEEGAS